jgi:nicotinamide-nucleotide amidase
LRVTAKAATPTEARAIALPVIEQIKERTQLLCYGENEDSLESVVGKLLSEANLKLAVAESCTGGLVSKRLTDIAGSSNYTDLNIVTYANWAKEEMLGVPKQLLEKHGAVSAECAEAMAKGIHNVSRAHIGLSITGVAGPGASDTKPAGLVYVGLAAADFYVGKVINHSSDLSRMEIRHRSASYALNMVRLFLLDKKSL